MDKTLYYDQLGLTRAATQEDINKAYRRLALQWHPNRNSKENKLEAEKRFGEISEAYDTLSDAKRRAIYDQFGLVGLKKGVPVGKLDWDDGYTYHGQAEKTFYEFFGNDNPFAEIFEYAAEAKKAVYNGLIGMGRKHKNEPMLINLPVTLEEFYSGGVKKVHFMRREFTPEDNTTVEKKKVFDIFIKPGWKHGIQVKFENASHEEFHKIAGDVIVTLEQTPHELFTRDGNDLITRKPIDLQQALTGTRITVDTIDRKKLNVNVTDVIKPGFRKVITKNGMPDPDAPDKRGNLVIEFDINFPQYITPDQKLMIRAALEPRQRPRFFGY